MGNRFLEYYMVKSYNFTSGEILVHKIALEPAVAKSIVRHYNKISSKSVIYYAEEEPIRYW